MANTNPYLTFSSPNSFTLVTANSTKNWDGTLEYSTDLKNWATWDGTTTLNSSNDVEHVLYVRGTGNSVITGSFDKKWTLTGSNISCSGNIENLLDYETVIADEHPSMGWYCYYEMFKNCASLITAPELPATTLAYSCYNNMFGLCTSLTVVHELPVTTLTVYCYANMFSGCTSLLHIPVLKADTLISNCYNSMFKNIGITISETKSSTTPYPYRVPLIGDGTTATNALTNMFSGVTGNIPTPEINKTYYISHKPIGGFEVKEVKKDDEVIGIKHYHIYTDSTLTENAYTDSAFGAEALYDAYKITDTEYNTLMALIN